MTTTLPTHLNTLIVETEALMHSDAMTPAAWAEIEPVLTEIKIYSDLIRRHDVMRRQRAEVLEDRLRKVLERGVG